MKDLMNKVTEAKKAAEANLIARHEETAAMRSQVNTAKLLEGNLTLMRLRRAKPAFLYTTPKTRKMPSFLGFFSLLPRRLVHSTNGQKGALSGVYTPGQNFFPWPETGLRGPERVGVTARRVDAHVGPRGPLGGGRTEGPTGRREPAVGPVGDAGGQSFQIPAVVTSANAPPHRAQLGLQHRNLRVLLGKAWVRHPQLGQ